MAVKAMKAGAIEFLTKPIREQDLLDAVHSALVRERAKKVEHKKISDLRIRFDSLRERERQVMELVCAGLTNKQVARRIGVSEITAKVHRHNLMKKLGAKSVVELVRMAASLGFPGQR